MPTPRKVCFYLAGLFLLFVAGSCRENTPNQTPVLKSGDSNTPLARDRIQSISIRLDEETLSLERNQDNSWKLTAPVSAPADEAAVKSLLSELENTSFSEAISLNPSEKSLSEMGLRPPRIELRIMTTIPVSEEIIFLGNENPFDASVYARKKGFSSVYSLPGSLRWAISRGSMAYRDRTLFHFDETQLSSIRFVRPSSFALEKEEGGSWRIAGSRSRPANQTFIERFLKGLKKEKARNFMAEEVQKLDSTHHSLPLNEFYLSLRHAPSIRVRVFSQGTTWIEDKDGKHVVETSPGFLELTSRKMKDFEDNRLLIFDPQAVALITFRLPDGTVLSAQRVKGAPLSNRWEITHPRQGPAADAKISAFLWQASHLKGLEAISPPKNFQSATEVRLFSASRKELAHLEMNSKQNTFEDMRFVRIHNQDVHAVEDSSLRTWPGNTDEWLSTALQDGGN